MVRELQAQVQSLNSELKDLRARELIKDQTGANQPSIRRCWS